MRFLGAIARGLRDRAPSTTAADLLLPHTFHTRASILDLDVNLHVNNASLILQTEFARWNWAAQRDLIVPAFRRGWSFIMGSQSVRYRREVGPFEKMEIETCLLARDQRWFWIKHSVSKRDSEGRQLHCAYVLARTIVCKGREAIPSEDVLKGLGFSEQDVALLPMAKNLPQIKAFLDWDAHIKKETNT